MHAAWSDASPPPAGMTGERRLPAAPDTVPPSARLRARPFGLNSGLGRGPAMVPWFPRMARRHRRGAGLTARVPWANACWQPVQTRRACRPRRRMQCARIGGRFCHAARAANGARHRADRLSWMAVAVDSVTCLRAAQQHSGEVRGRVFLLLAGLRTRGSVSGSLGFMRADSAAGRRTKQTVAEKVTGRRADGGAAEAAGLGGRRGQHGSSENDGRDKWFQGKHLPTWGRLRPGVNVLACYTIWRVNASKKRTVWLSAWFFASVLSGSAVWCGRRPQDRMRSAGMRIVQASPWSPARAGMCRSGGKAGIHPGQESYHARPRICRRPSHFPRRRPSSARRKPGPRTRRRQRLRPR